MRKSISFLTFLVASIILFTQGSVSASSQTAKLIPTSAVVGTAHATYIMADGSPSIERTYGGQIQNPDKALVQDSQSAVFNPATTIPGADENSDSYLFLGFSSIPICEQASIQNVKVRVVWSQSATSPQNDDAAALLIFSDPARLDYSYNLGTLAYTILEQNFGGLGAPSYSGNAPAALTEESSDVQTTPTLAQLKDPNARLYITLGEAEGSITGQLDAAWLEVNYDDSACSTSTSENTVPSTTTPTAPKTGLSNSKLALATACAVAFTLSLAGTLIFLHKKDKSKSAR